MEHTFVVLLTLLPASISVTFAGILAYQEKPGWGWFLFIAFFIGGAAAA
jgi:membrane protein DedA with SNARE-associated domain